MSAPTHEPERDVERLLELARRAQPAESSTTDVRRLARRAALAGIERGRAQRLHRSIVWAGIACGAIALLAAVAPLRHAVRDELLAAFGPEAPAPRAPTSWEPLELAMPAGDRLFASPGAQFELLENTQATRRIALRDGTAVFSVEPLGEAGQFSVQTPHARVQVRGTVFSVEVDAQRTRVRVHEGSVIVHSGTTARSLRAGERYGSDAAPVPELPSEPLSKRIAQLVVERMQRRADEVARARERGATDASVGPGHEPPETSAPSDVRAPATSWLVKDEPLPMPSDDGMTLEQARALLHAGAAQRALAVARAQDDASTRGEWLMLQGDALRALDEPIAAVHAYRAAERALRGEARAHAAFKAADLLLRVLDEPAAALAMLDRARLDAPIAPLRERALLLRIDARHRLGLPVHALAHRYLDDYPDSVGAERMRALVSKR